MNLTTMAERMRWDLKPISSPPAIFWAHQNPFSQHLHSHAELRARPVPSMLYQTSSLWQAVPSVPQPAESRCRRWPSGLGTAESGRRRLCPKHGDGDVAARREKAPSGQHRASDSMWHFAWVLRGKMQLRRQNENEVSLQTKAAWCWRQRHQQNSLSCLAPGEGMPQVGHQDGSAAISWSTPACADTLIEKDDVAVIHTWIGCWAKDGNYIVTD